MARKPLFTEKLYSFWLGFVLGEARSIERLVLLCLFTPPPISLSCVGFTMHT